MVFRSAMVLSIFNVSACILIALVSAAPTLPDQVGAKLTLDTPINALKMHNAPSHKDVIHNAAPVTSSESTSADDREYDGFYDITVGDVIRDVLLTLRDHPEIVKVLIQRERERLADHLTEMDSLVNSEDTLAAQPGNQHGNQTEYVSLKPFQPLPNKAQLLQRFQQNVQGKPEESASEESGRWFNDKVQDVPNFSVGYNPEVDLPNIAAPSVDQKQASHAHQKQSMIQLHHKLFGMSTGGSSKSSNNGNAPSHSSEGSADDKQADDRVVERMASSVGSHDM